MRLPLVLMVIAAATSSLSAQAPGGAPPQAGGRGTAAAAPMILTIPGFPDGGHIDVRFSQAAPGAAPGGGTSPAMRWTSVPGGTRSFVLNVHDTDTVRGRTTDDQAHWVVWNIPATATGLPEGVPAGSPLADGSYQISASGPMYRGPGAAASGAFHHYAFDLYALDVTLEVKPSADAFATRADVLRAMQGHILAKAVYWGLFRRPR